MSQKNIFSCFRKAEVGLKKVQEVGADGAVVSSNRSTLAYGNKKKSF